MNFRQLVSSASSLLSLVYSEMKNSPEIHERVISNLLREGFRLLIIGERSNPATDQYLNAAGNWTQAGYQEIISNSHYIFRRKISGSTPAE